LETPHPLSKTLSEVALCPSFALLIGKGKAILANVYSGPEGSRMLRLPDFMTIGT